MHWLEYWRSGAGLDHIHPPGQALPESPEFIRFLCSFGHGTVLDIGCGWGRLARCFPSAGYLGVDICPRAIRIARRKHPDRQFHVVDDDLPFPDRNVALLHTVLLHVPDDALVPMLRRVRATTLVVSEIMDRKRRRAGDPPVFNRDHGDYAIALEQADFSPIWTERFTYRRYGDDTKMTAIISYGGRTR